MYFLIITYFYLYYVYEPLISLILTFFTVSNKFRSLKDKFFLKKEVPQNFYLVRKYEIDRGNFHNFIYMKSLIFSKKALILRFLPTYSTYLFFKIITYFFIALVIVNNCIYNIRGKYCVTRCTFNHCNIKLKF